VSLHLEVVGNLRGAGAALHNKQFYEGRDMGYGLGVFLLAVGLILAFAVQDAINGVDLTAVGYILAAVGVLAIVLTAVTVNRARGARNVTTTTHADGSQSTTESRNRVDPPA
jgi:Domain of unknown function (DUF6458)